MSADQAAVQPSEKDPGACMMLVELARQGIIFNQLNLLPIFKYPRIRLFVMLNIKIDISTYLLSNCKSHQSIDLDD